VRTKKNSHASYSDAGIEGPEVCRRVRRDTRTESTHIILLTALSQREEMVAGLESSFIRWTPFESFAGKLKNDDVANSGSP
jgi:CheY-like chemotaxis protein